MADTLLKVDGINVYYGNIHAVKDISFTVNAGEIVITTLMGAKDDSRKADKYLKALIMNNSSAIMIKEIYYSEISDEIKVRVKT